MRSLEPAEFASVVGTLVIDSFKASNAMFRYSTSARVKNLLDDLDTLAWELKSFQIGANVDFPVQLTREVSGLVETWAKGTTWRELCQDTSLDQGDVCRLLRRTLEILKQIPQAYGIPPEIAQISMDAVKAMDRFPVADEQDDGNDNVLTTGAGVGFDGTGSSSLMEGGDGKISSDIDEELLKLLEESDREMGADDDDNGDEPRVFDLDILSDVLNNSENEDFPEDFFDQEVGDVEVRGGKERGEMTGEESVRQIIFEADRAYSNSGGGSKSRYGTSGVDANHRGRANKRSRRRR